MRRATKSVRRAGTGATGPVSVVLPHALRAQVEAEAHRRGLKLSPAVRALVAERLRELSDDEQLTRAEEWQRAQAWATLERLRSGDRTEISRADLARHFDAARRRATRYAR